MIACRMRASNYRSIGEEKSELMIASAITVIIGKNESGKSNLLEAMGEIDFSRVPYQIDSADRKLNRFSTSAKEFTITLTCKNNNKLDEYTKITAKKDELRISGHLIDEVRNNDRLRSLLRSQAKNFTSLEDFYNKFEQNPYSLIESIEKATRYYTDIGGRSDVIAELREIIEIASAYASELPYLIHVSNDDKNSLKDYYFIDEIAELEEDDIFYKLLDVAGIPSAKLVELLKIKMRSISFEFVRAALERVSNDFAKFSGRKLPLILKESEGRVQLMTEFEGNILWLSELPISLRWLFSLYMEVASRRIRNKHILFVFDQPGLYMHVNAQKELVDVFKLLASQGHQVIYSTHSPYLLDISDLSGIRAVEKSRGQSFIYNKIYAAENLNDRNQGRARIETLTPIFEALGVGIAPTGFLDANKLNIIVEGISDYYYLKAMLYYLNKQGEFRRGEEEGQAAGDDYLPYVLPAVGASNIANVASILIGWGQPFKAVVDYDEEGNRAAEKMEEKLGLTMGEDIFYINGNSSYREDETQCRVEDLLDDKDRRAIASNQSRRTKALLSREFYDQIKAGILIPSKNTTANFRKLIKRLMGMREGEISD